MANATEGQDARFGERMIELKVHFWTNGIAEGRGRIKPKHAWTRGMITIVRNRPHEIAPERGRPFNSLMELPAAVEKVLLDHGVQLHLCSKTARYILPG